jgi:SM-20-related protein
MNDFTQTVNDLATHGWSLTTDFLPPDTITRLAWEIRQHFSQGDMRQAGVSLQRQVNTNIRSDFILWLEEGELTAAQRIYFDALEQLRQEVNAGLQLGIFEFEGHAALYPAGSFYQRHLDRFQNNNQRSLSCILYLNEHWQESDGGLLRLYLNENEHMDIVPKGGLLVAFLSDRFWHEVLPANKERLSITGWFKTRGPALP